MNKTNLQLSFVTGWFPRTLPVDSLEWKQLRKIILERDDYTCRFCGLKLSKYMIVDHIDGNAGNNELNNLGLNCKACDAIRHCGFNANLNGYLTLRISALTQTEIVQRTNEFYLQHRRNPLPEEIDPECQDFKHIPIYFRGELDWYLMNENVMELAEYLLNIHLASAAEQNELLKFKAFFTEKMDLTYLQWIINE